MVWGDFEQSHLAFTFPVLPHVFEHFFSCKNSGKKNPSKYCVKKCVFKTSNYEIALKRDKTLQNFAWPLDRKILPLNLWKSIWKTNEVLVLVLVPHIKWFGLGKNIFIWLTSIIDWSFCTGQMNWLLFEENCTQNHNCPHHQLQ